MKHPLLGKLEYEARVKPEIKKLVDNVYNMTDEEIDAAQTPLPWFKQALKIMRDTAKQDEFEAWLLANAKYGETEDLDGTAFRYTGGDFFANAFTGMQVEVLTGEVFWCPKTGGVWVQETFCKVIPQEFKSCTLVSEMKKSRYCNFYKEEIAKRHGMYQSPESTSGGIRFYRH